MKILINKWLSRLAPFAMTLSIGAHAYDMNWVNGHLDAFNSGKDGAFMYSKNHAHVAKHNPNTGALLYNPETGEPNIDPISRKPLIHPLHFSRESILSKQFIIDKDFFDQSAERNKRLKKDIAEGTAEGFEAGRAPIRKNDLAEDLVGDLKYSKLDDMKDLQSGRVEVPSWSDSYWPIYQGVIASRYVDQNFPTNWEELQSYIQEKRPFLSQNQSSNDGVSQKNQCSLDDLSPAEKYDLIVGDTDDDGKIIWHMRDAMLAEGGVYDNEFKKPEDWSWMGICHGWTPASMRVSRPMNIIKVMTANGQNMNMYPSDIKALSSLLWAQTNYKKRFISGRCNDKEADMNVDKDNGRILSQDCFDTNPGTWHKVVVNQIGHSKKSFILDATFDYEVWNQPAHAYEYTYFNPKDGKKVDKIEDAKVKADIIKTDENGKHATFEGDKFWKYRGENTKFIVGVAMKFVYIAETVPSHTDKDNPDADRQVAVNYLYDLELAEDSTILGGEWYHHEHPDFVWMPDPQDEAKSIADKDLPGSDQWDGMSQLPDSYTAAAIKAANHRDERTHKRKPQPLAAIVKTLATRSTLGK